MSDQQLTQGSSGAPPSYNEATLPPYDGYRLPGYAEAIFLTNQPPPVTARSSTPQITGEIARAVLQRTNTVRITTRALEAQVRSMQSRMPSNSNHFRSLNQIAIEIRALSDAAENRSFRANVITERIMMLENRGAGTSSRPTPFSRQLSALRNDLSRIYREAIEAEESVSGEFDEFRLRIRDIDGSD